MLGAKKDVLGYIPSQMFQLDSPGNRFINDPLLLKPLLGVANTNNRRERLISQRETTIALNAYPKGQFVSVYRENEKMVPDGGVIPVPSGGLLGRLFNR